VAKLRREEARLRRHRRVRKKVFGTLERPRMAVYRSLKHIYIQLVDDTRGVTLLSASSLDPDFPKELRGSNRDGAKAVGSLAAQRALAKGITSVVFDRGGYLYHGRLKALAEGAREGGLQF
jgi:large subunit ribosomal protein L18